LIYDLRFLAGKICYTFTATRRNTMRFKIVLEESDEGGYTVYAPSLPGCISEGETKEEALKNIWEAIELHLEPVELA
jgi:predicted RNase H-like HicB family nuclease